MIEPESIPSVASPSMELRPLSTGELLDRVFFLYRAHVPLFLAIALVPASLGLLAGGAQLLVRGNLAGHGPAAAIAVGVFVLLYLVAAFGGFAICQAATTSLVAQLYLHGTGKPGLALRAALPRTLRYIGIEFWKIWSLIWLPYLLGAVAFGLFFAKYRVAGGILGFLAALSIIYGVIAYLRNSLAVPASVMESLPVRAAMRRSKDLVGDRKRRIFLLYLLLAVLYGVAFAIQAPLLLFVAHAKAPTQHIFAIGLQLLLSFAVSLLLSPVASIALCLFYFDERVRREGFDIDFLLRGSDAVLPTPANSTSLGPQPGSSSMGSA